MKATIDKLKALGEPNRFRIMMMLRNRPLCVCEIQCVLNISGATLSSHLKILRHATLIDSKRDGKWIEYFISDDSVIVMLENLVNDIEDVDQINQDSKKISETDRNICSSKNRKSCT